VKTRLSAAGAAVAAAALAASAIMATTGTAHAADTATITVNAVDQYGQPAAVQVDAIDQAGQIHYDGPQASTPVSSVHVFTNLPADGYSFVTIGPWSGIECSGINPCAAPFQNGLTPVVTVAEGGAASYTVHVTMPTVTGGSAIGNQLTIQTSLGYKYLQMLAEAQSGQSGQHSQQWLRGTAAIPAATAPTYVTVPADAAQQVSARLHPSPAVAYLYAQGGNAAPDFVTNSITIDKAAPVPPVVKLKTKTKATIAKRVDVGERATIKVKVKAKGATTDPDGLVTVTIGKFKARKTLKKGVVFINLPNLKAGTYTILTTYSGSDGFEKSKAKRTLTVG
jgi:Big-like domain-containing protein